MLAVSIDLSDAVLKSSPLLPELFHHLCCLQSLFSSQIIALFGLLLLPALKHLLEIIVELLYPRIDLFLQAIFLVLNFVVEGIDAGIKFPPHRLKLGETHGLACDLLDHQILFLALTK